MHKIIITRPIEFALPLQSALAKHHIDSLIFPTIDICSIETQANIDHIDYCIFISRNAVTYGAKLLNSNSKTLAIGKGTYDALSAQGFTPSIEPEKPYNSEQFLQHPRLPIQATDHIAIIKGQGGRNLLRDQLEQQAASVRTIDVYRRQISQPSQERQQTYQNTLANNCQAIFINSIESLDNLLSLTPENMLNILLNQQLITGSARVVKAAKTAGFTQTALQADSTTDNDMIACVLQTRHLS